MPDSCATAMTTRTEPLYGVPPTQNVIDGRIGLRADLDLFQLEIAWVGVSNHTAAYLITGRSSPNGVVAALSLLLLGASAPRPAQRPVSLRYSGPTGVWAGSRATLRAPARAAK